MSVNTLAPVDTQWPRFEVFQQVREGAPFANVGAVHAPDPEIALQNARDVFVRRPHTHRLWVVPATEILSRTAEQLADGQEQAEAPDEAPDLTAVGDERRYYIFRKTSQRRSMNFVTQWGDVQAASPQSALRLALEQFAEDRPAFVWWIVPANAVLSSRDEDVSSMFEPAHDKSYRMPTEYHTQTMMRELEAQDHDA